MDQHVDPLMRPPQAGHLVARHIAALLFLCGWCMGFVTGGLGFGVLGEEKFGQGQSGSSNM